jgi:GNAT superfamily N-acetyltransferase
MAANLRSDVILRQALAADIASIQRVRRAVHENRLVSTTITDEHVRAAIEDTGRGWVVASGGEVVAFAVGDATNGNLWALFVDPAFERRGFGRRLHDVTMAWLAARGVRRAWLTTEPGTRAQSFYEAAGWRRTNVTEGGELRYERDPDR